MMTVSEKSIIVERACSIIFSNEGDYGSVNLDDNGAVSIGKVQWHGCRALALLKSIIDFSNTAAQSILGDALFNEIVSSSDWDTRTLNQDEADRVSALLLTAQGRSSQDFLASTDVLSYINKGLSYGLLNSEALIYFADGVNQYGTESYLWKNIVITALKENGSLDAIHQATMSICSENLARRESVYQKLKSENTSKESVSATTNPIKIKPGPEAIKTIQKWCNDYHFTGTIIDGIYGSETKAAIIQCLQYFINTEEKIHPSLIEDGKWGPLTQGICPFVSSECRSTTKLAFIAQALLYLNGYDPCGLDSIFGINSANAAKLFQTEHNLTPDGAVGALTFAELLK